MQISDAVTVPPSLHLVYLPCISTGQAIIVGLVRVRVRISDAVTVPPSLHLVYLPCISTGQAIIVGLVRVCVRISDGPDDGLDITNYSLGTHTIKKNISDRKYAFFYLCTFSS